MPFEIHDEIAVSTGPLGKWIRAAEVKNVLILDEEVDRVIFNHVLSTGYAADLNDSEIEKFGRDPFLVAYACADKSNRIVVMKEVSAPGKLRANRKVPDVCTSNGVRWMRDFDFFRALGFSTKG